MPAGFFILIKRYTMSKVKSDKTPHYELLYLVSNKYSEAELEPIKTKVNKLIENHGGEISYSETMGKRRLAYAIKGFRYGYYELVEFDLAGSELIKLEKDLKLDHEILRHQVVKKIKLTAEEIKAEATRIAERLAKDNAEEVKEEVKTPEVKEEIKEEVKIEEVKEEIKPEEKIEEVKKETKTTHKKKGEETISLDTDKELDSELDKILSGGELMK